jgi:hypothetical protein
VGVEPSATKVSYFIGDDSDNWQSNLLTYNAVSLGEVYAGISLSLQAHGDNVEKIFTVEPNTNPDVIRVRVEGAADALRVNETGELEIETAAGVVRFTKPVAFQERGGTREDVEVDYMVCDRETYGFIVGNYDSTRPLIIDPLLASTFIGGSSGTDVAYAIALDAADDVYVAGVAQSSNYPTTAGAYDSSHNGRTDVFVSKLSSDLSSLSASTFIGGSSYDSAYAITIDSSGNLYVAGVTESSDYPTTEGAYDSNGHYDVFVSKLSSDLGSLLASTFIGGSSNEYAHAITIDPSGNPCVAGRTYSSDYPTTEGAYDSSHNGDYDVFVSKLSSDLSSLLASTFIGGSNRDHAHAITIDSSGNLYVTGYTSSSNYPTTTGAYDSSHNGDDVFVSKLSSDLGSLLASTFIGGSNRDHARAITIDSSGNLYVTGYTSSSNYPTTTGAYDSSFNGGVRDVFVSKLSSDLSNLSAGTFIGGGSYDHARASTIDSSGNLYVTGYTSSSNYPTTADAYDSSHNGYDDVFVSKLDRELSKICACDADGNPEEQFAPGQTVYVWGNGLLANTEYNLWIQDEGVTEGKTLNTSEDPSGIQETNSTDASGTLAVTGIWAINASASPIGDEWDIVADKVGAGECTYNAADDGIDSVSEVGFVTPIKLNQPPIALFTYYPEKPVANETITFNASTSFDPDGTIVNYEWDFDDGNLRQHQRYKLNEQTHPSIITQCSSSSSYLNSNWISGFDRVVKRYRSQQDQEKMPRLKPPTILSMYKRGNKYGR